MRKQFSVFAALLVTLASCGKTTFSPNSQTLQPKTAGKLLSTLSLTTNNTEPLRADVKSIVIMKGSASISNALVNLGRSSDLNTELDFSNAVEDKGAGYSDYTTNVYIPFKSSRNTYVQISVTSRESDVSDSGHHVGGNSVGLVTINHYEKYSNGGSFSQYDTQNNTVNLAIVASDDATLSAQSLQNGSTNEVVTGLSPQSTNTRAIFFRNVFQTQSLSAMSVSTLRNSGDPVFASDREGVACVQRLVNGQVKTYCGGKLITDCPGLSSTLKAATEGLQSSAVGFLASTVTFIAGIATSETGIGIVVTGAGLAGIASNLTGLSSNWRYFSIAKSNFNTSGC